MIKFDTKNKGGGVGLHEGIIVEDRRSEQNDSWVETGTRQLCLVKGGRMNHLRDLRVGCLSLVANFETKGLFLPDMFFLLPEKVALGNA
mmetsp:Transcript_2914/g.6269  ORF Transcript_2914/g.6269 Transcript_2914/m.6269 type:complete len:89 (+) Transcript_2914:190-456(+)